MVRPPELEVRRLKAIAREMFEAADESGYLVSAATSQHAAFRNSRRPSGALERELFVDAARRAASQHGFHIDEVSGGTDLVTSSDGYLRKYRVKRGTRTAEGDYKFVCGLGSSLLRTEIDTLFTEERWLLGYVSSDDHTLDHVIAAKIIGSSSLRSGPVTLTLGPVINLRDTTPPPRFTSSDEDLEGFEDDAERDEDGDAGIA